MSQPIFPKGVKVVKGKVVQRKLPTSQIATHSKLQSRIQLKRALASTERTGPRLAPGQQSTTEGKRQPGYVGKSIEDPRLARELPKNKPGRLDSKFATQTAKQKVEGYEGVQPASAREIELNQRQTNPSLEGRGASPLSKIIDAMRGEKMPAPLLEQLKGLDPAKLEKILELINQSKYRTVASKGRQELNAEAKRSRAQDLAATKDYDENYGRNQNEM